MVQDINYQQIHELPKWAKVLSVIAESNFCSRQFPDLFGIAICARYEKAFFFFFLRLFFVCAFSYSPAFGTKTVKVWCTFKYGMQNQSSTEYINIDVVVVVVVVAHQSARNMVATMT